MIKDKEPWPVINGNIVDATAWGDYVAEVMREYYELNRESFFDRRKKIWTIASDHLMLNLYFIASQGSKLYTEYHKEDKK